MDDPILRIRGPYDDGAAHSVQVIVGKQAHHENVLRVLLGLL